MHHHHTAPFVHGHHFAKSDRGLERRTWLIVAITVVMMVAEIAAGWVWNSMALTADGWHMGTHALAIGVAGAAYALSRRWAGHPQFSLGSWKIEVLGAYTSACILVAVALWVGVESVHRLWMPVQIDFTNSLIVAVIGLVVNLICAALLHAQDGHQHDLNARAAYLHIVTDALTSVLAIAALVAGKWLGWLWLDALMGALGAVLIVVWAKKLIIESAKVLLDREMDHPLAQTVREALERDGDTWVTDLHLWRVGPEQFACHAGIVADAPHTPTHYRARLAAWPTLVHVSIECNVCKPPRVEAAV
jgi:cation diffusion facilitator family transporter